MTNNNKQKPETVETAVETVETVETAVETVETAVETVKQATVDKLFAEVNELSTEEFNTLCNRLSLKQLETVQKLFAARLEAEKDWVEKDVLTARSEEITPTNIAAVKLMLSADDTTPEVLKSLPKSLFNQLFIAAIAAQQPEKPAKTEKHNDLSHQIKLLITRFSYIKEANCDNFNVRPVQLLEPLTLADFTAHCQKNTFANNTNYPVTIDGKQYNDKPSAVQAMAELMYKWYTASVKAVA